MPVTLHFARDVLTRFVIAEGSMRPALSPGDYVLAVRRRAVPRRGDIIVFESRPGFWLCKRVVGLPSEELSIDAGSVSIDDRPLVEPWTIFDTAGKGTWTLGPREVFVLGDVRHGSDGDSRQVGPISVDPAWWQVRWRYWPVRRVGSASTTVR